MDKYYDEIAEGYNELHRDEQIAKLEKAFYEGYKFDMFSDVKTVLDVGCGTGVSTDFFAEKGFETCGVDPSSKLIEQNKKLKLIVASAEEIIFDDNSFDLVVSFTAIQNFSDVCKGLSEIKRVGRGKFILTYLKGVNKDKEIHELISRVFEKVIHFEDNKEHYFLVF